jgi:hypothetical protein
MRPTHSVHLHAHTFVIAIKAIVSLLTLVSLAQAEIVYTPTNFVIDGSYHLDVNDDGVTDFTIGLASGGDCFTRRGAWKALEETPASGNGAIVGPMKGGAEIGPNAGFSEGTLDLVVAFGRGAYRVCIFSVPAGPWASCSPPVQGCKRVSGAKFSAQRRDTLWMGSIEGHRARRREADRLRLRNCPRHGNQSWPNVLKIGRLA